MLSCFKRNKLHEIKQQTLWIHALSVGEVLSSVPLVKSLAQDISNKRIVFSVSTKTGYEIACKLLPETVDSIFFFPYDLCFSVKLIAKKIDPSIVVIVESDIWPNFLFEMKNRNIPVLLVNARLSDRSFKGYKRFSFFVKKILSVFDKICAQSKQDAERYLIIGVPPEKLTITGNIKFDQDDIEFSEVETSALKSSMRIHPERKILLAGSTHNGEESLILEAFKKLKKHLQSLVLIIAPRDPKRAASVCEIYKSAGYTAIQLKNIAEVNPDQESDVVIIDIIGILKKLYSIADAAFIGGSLVKRGGHNPLEPAAFAKPIIFGPDMSNFAEISGMLSDAKAAKQVFDAEEFYEAALTLLEDEKAAVKMGKNAYEVFCDNKGAVDKTVDEIVRCLPLL
ncbi:MAG: 3-deoxy-D-manno-octulosonic acid transferase [Deltaproteobacteria bacterium]|nr:3-deoxy-D-manno-octulosonic acid transferase [Deltaproteobacteria bacterium]